MEEGGGPGEHAGQVQRSEVDARLGDGRGGYGYAASRGTMETVRPHLTQLKDLKAQLCSEIMKQERVQPHTWERIVNGTVEVVKLALQERVRQRIVEQAVEAPVRQIMKEVVEMVKEIYSERVSERGVEQVDVPVSRVVEQPAVEETMDVPVSRTQQRVVEEIIDVPVPHVMEETVETVKHIPLERVLNYAVEQSVDVPDPPIQEEIVEVIPFTRQNQTPGRVCDEIAELNDDHKKFYEQFVKCMKLGIRENSVDDFEIAELLRINTSKSGDEQISLEEYVDRMKEGQNDIHYITGESIAVGRRKGYEVLYVADPVAENAVHQLKEVDGTMPKPTTKEGLDFGDQDEKETLEELNIESEPLRKLMKEALGNENVDFGKVITMIEKRVSWFQQEQADDDDKKTFGLISSGRAEDGDTSLAIDIESHESAVADPTEQLTGSEAPRAAAQHRSTQQHNKCQRKQRQQPRKKEEEEKGRAEREKEEEREAEKGGGEQVKKDVTGWTVVTRSKKQKQRRVQIFVK